MKSSDFHYLVAGLQSILGGVAWFYVFGTTFTRPATFDNLVLPLAVAAAGSTALSAFWSFMSSVPAYLVALYYSLPFIGWMIFQSISGGDLKSSLFWLSITAGVYMCGLAGSSLAHVMKLCKRSTQSELEQ